MNGGATNRARRHIVPPVAVGSGPGSVGLHGRVNASDGRAPRPCTLTNRPARGSRKRARLCRVARAGKRFRRQGSPALSPAPSREPELGLDPQPHRVDRGARGASVANERRCYQPGTPTHRPARGSRKRARLCRVARAGKRFRRQGSPALSPAPSREPELGLDPQPHRVDRGARGASVANERRCYQPGTPTHRPARGSRKRARLCRAARAGKRYRRQGSPALHADKSSRPWQ
ncbi:uncharacterized protein [Asterias amurensis]|uniref:uncharacterized protein n=1 Tax=Asterias amurensis TaxID=7602 RepID=UPI003AB7A259